MLHTYSQLWANSPGEGAPGWSQGTLPPHPKFPWQAGRGSFIGLPRPHPPRPHLHRHHHRAHHEAHQHQLVCPYIAPRATKFHAITTTHTGSFVLLQFSVAFFVCRQLPNKIFSCWESLTSLQTRFLGFVVSLCSLMRQIRGCQVSCARFSPTVCHLSLSTEKKVLANSNIYSLTLGNNVSYGEKCGQA